MKESTIREENRNSSMEEFYEQGLPEYLQHDLDAYKEGLKTHSTLLDCLWGELYGSINIAEINDGFIITRPDYDVPRLERLITRTAQKYGVMVYLEPGEACALNAGYLVTTVLDIVKNGSTSVAVLDASAACHMPDVIEMPYLPPLFGAHPADGEEAGAHVYRLAGPTCLAGDVIGYYGFPCELHIGNRLVFGDMAIYTTCKNNTFNGMPLPDIVKISTDGEVRKLTDFGYDDFKRRLGS